MEFEWDEEKNKKNMMKHGIDFGEAARVFLDPNHLEIPDPCCEEEQWDAICMVSKVLFVVYAEKKDDLIRVISARKADKEEINGYKKGYYGRD